MPMNEFAFFNANMRVMMAHETPINHGVLHFKFETSVNILRTMHRLPAPRAQQWDASEKLRTMSRERTAHRHANPK